jgi:hypothetical protein
VQSDVLEVVIVQGMVLHVTVVVGIVFQMVLVSTIFVVVLEVTVTNWFVSSSSVSLEGCIKFSLTRLIIIISALHARRHDARTIKYPSNGTIGRGPVGRAVYTRCRPARRTSAAGFCRIAISGWATSVSTGTTVATWTTISPARFCGVSGGNEGEEDSFQIHAVGIW